MTYSNWFNVYFSVQPRWEHNRQILDKLKSSQIKSVHWNCGELSQNSSYQIFNLMGWTGSPLISVIYFLNENINFNTNNNNKGEINAKSTMSMWHPAAAQTQHSSGAVLFAAHGTSDPSEFPALGSDSEGIILLIEKLPWNHRKQKSYHHQKLYMWWKYN